MSSAECYLSWKDTSLWINWLKQSFLRSTTTLSPIIEKIKVLKKEDNPFIKNMRTAWKANWFNLSKSLSLIVASNNLPDIEGIKT